MAEKLVEEGIAISTGDRKEEVEGEYKRSGDMGLAVQVIKSKTKMKRLDSKKYTISEMYERVGKIAGTGGEGSKDRKRGRIADMIGIRCPDRGQVHCKVHPRAAQARRWRFHHNGGALCNRHRRQEIQG